MFISFSSQSCLEHVKELSYIPKKIISKGVSHALIRDYLTLALRGFVIGSQILNLTPTLSFDHNSCILSLNEQCEGTLAFTPQDLSNGILGAQFGACLFFQPRF
jgi:hypothetical protein